MMKQRFAVISFALSFFGFIEIGCAEDFSLSSKSTEKMLVFQSTLGKTTQRMYSDSTQENTNYQQFLMKNKGKDLDEVVHLWQGRYITATGMRISENLDIDEDAIVNGKRSKATLTTVIYYDIGLPETTVKTLELSSYKKNAQEWKAQVIKVQRYIELLGIQFLYEPSSATTVQKTGYSAEQFRSKGGQSIIVYKKSIPCDPVQPNKTNRMKEGVIQKSAVRIKGGNIDKKSAITERPVAIPSQIVTEAILDITNLDGNSSTFQGTITRLEDGKTQITGTATKFDVKGQPIK